MKENKIYIDLASEKFTIKFDDIIKKYIQSCEWIGDFGINWKASRFGDYKKDIDKFIRNSGNIDSGDTDKMSLLFNAFFEAHELIRIRNAFESRGDSISKEILKKASSGQKFRKLSPNDQSRNFAFELSIAARFVKAGYNVDMSQITDVVVDINGKNLFVECKRVRSQKQLSERLKDGAVQINKRLSNDRSFKSNGLIAVNVNDLINPEAFPFLSKNLNSYAQSSISDLKYFVSTNEDIYLKRKPKKCLAIFTEYTTSGFIMPDNIHDSNFINHRHGNISQYTLKNNERDFLNEFWAKMGDQSL